MIILKACRLKPFGNIINFYFWKKNLCSQKMFKSDYCCIKISRAITDHTVSYLFYVCQSNLIKGITYLRQTNIHKTCLSQFLVSSGLNDLIQKSNDQTIKRLKYQLSILILVLSAVSLSYCYWQISCFNGKLCSILSVKLWADGGAETTFKCIVKTTF